VLVVDTQGHAGDASGMYMVEPGPNQSPTLVSADYDSETYALTLKTNDSDGDSVTIEINTPADMLAEPQVVTADAQGNAVSYLSGYGMVTGGEVSLTVSDSQTGGSRTYNVTISGMTFETDTLYAIPLKTRAEVDEEVNLVVITGPIALNKPFQFMNGVGLVMPDGGTTSSLHFNHGAPGGKAGDVDGFWEAVDPGGGFLLPPDIFWPAPTDIGDGLERWDFFAIPIGGRDIAGEGGALFNCRYAFTYAGQYELSFQEATGVVKRTYYSDSEINEGAYLAEETSRYP